tara:strand:- start:111 stop:1328 length:1218 start_codon:yes stop_codon:yes gene_type:complete
MPIGYGYGPGSTSMGTYNWGYGSGAPQSGAGGNIGQWEQWGEALQGHLGFGGSMGGDAYNQYLLEQQDPFSGGQQGDTYENVLDVHLGLTSGELPPDEAQGVIDDIVNPGVSNWAFDPTTLTGITPLFGEGFNPFGNLTNTGNVPPPTPGDMAFGTTGMDLSGVNIGMQGLNPGDAGYMTQDEYFDHINPYSDWGDDIGYDPELIGQFLEENEQAYLQNFANTLLDQGGLDPQYVESGLYGTEGIHEGAIGQELQNMIDEGESPFAISQWLQEQYLMESASDVIKEDFAGQFGSNIQPGESVQDFDVDVSSVPPTILNNVQNMINEGATAAQIQAYLQSMGGRYEGIGELADFIGGGGIGGTSAKDLYYPGQDSGFAGVGEGITGKGKMEPVQSTLEGLLKKRRG